MASTYLNLYNLIKQAKLSKNNKWWKVALTMNLGYHALFYMTEPSLRISIGGKVSHSVLNRDSFELWSPSVSSWGWGWGDSHSKGLWCVAMLETCTGHNTKSCEPQNGLSL